MRARKWVREAWDLVGADLPLFSLAACLTVTLSLFSFLILAPSLVVGLGIMFLEKMNGRQPRLANLWEGITEHFPASVVTWMVFIIATFPFHLADSVLQMLSKPWHWVGIAVALAGMWAVSIPLFFTLPLIADRDLSAREAMKLSWARVRPNLLSICVTALVIDVVCLFGAFACAFGLIITLPLAVGAWMLCYRDLLGDFGAPQMTPLLAGSEDEVKEDEG